MASAVLQPKHKRDRSVEGEEEYCDGDRARDRAFNVHKLNDA